MLGAYALYNPALGYTQGMSFIVAMLLLYVEPEEAFEMLVNLLDKSLLMSMFKMDHERMQQYWEIYDGLLEKNLPRLHAHLTCVHQLSSFVALRSLLVSLSLHCPS